MAFLGLWKPFVALAIVCAVARGPMMATSGQTPSVKPTQEPNSHAPRTFLDVYEGDEVRIPIPSGWSVSVPDNHAISKTDYPAVAQTFAPAPGDGLFLTKNGYILTLAYNSGHASGITGGRFIEVLQIPWIDDPFEGWDCGSLLQRRSQPVNRILLFTSLILDPAAPEVREKCAIPTEHGDGTNDDVTNSLVAGKRWFAAYFTTVHYPGWFFESDGAGCAEKAYTLTSGAKAPGELPMVDNPDLKKIIKEAIGIVASIRYKRCPPSDVSPR